jgi:hypothetical protein
MARLLAIGACVVVLLAGCGAGEPETPAACLRGSGPYLAALREAPGQVRLAGQTAISSCLAEDQAAGELSRVGAALVRTATALNAAARKAPGGQANLALGYLVGAVKRGAEETSGIHAVLVRRIAAAAEFNPGGARLPATYRSTLRRGEQAGRSHG